jgi:hypothetical protein
MRYLMLVVMLGGCSAIQDVKDDMRIDRYTRTCEKLGYAKDSEEFRDCLTKMVAARQSR